MQSPKNLQASRYRVLNNVCADSWWGRVAGCAQFWNIGDQEQKYNPAITIIPPRSKIQSCFPIQLWVSFANAISLFSFSWTLFPQIKWVCPQCFVAETTKMNLFSMCRKRLQWLIRQKIRSKANLDPNPSWAIYGVTLGKLLDLHVSQETLLEIGYQLDLREYQTCLLNSPQLALLE